MKKKLLLKYLDKKCLAIDEKELIVASTDINDNLPILVMPDEAKELAEKKFQQNGQWDANKRWHRVNGFIEGYNANPNKYSEEDLKKAIEKAYSRKENGDELYSPDEIIASLHPKPIAVMVEIEEICKWHGKNCSGNLDCNHPTFNAIKTNSQNQIIVTKEDLIYNKL